MFDADAISKRLGVLWISAIGVIVALVGFTFVKSLQLRPGGDDYCLAVAGQFGLVGGVTFWWESFSGFLTPTIFANTLVGVPVLNLPFGVSSALTFITAVVAVGLTGLLLLRVVGFKIVASRVLRWFVAVVVVSVYLVAWWSYWWLPPALGQMGDNLFLAQSITHNQNPAAGHVLQTVVVVAAAVLAVQWFQKGRHALKWVAAVFAGLAAGFSGPAMAGAFILTMFTVVAVFWNNLFTIGLPRRVPLMSAGVASVAVLVALAAPGSRIRAQELGTGFPLSPTAVGEVLNATFPRSIEAWAAGFVAPGAIPVVLLGAILGSGIWLMGIAIDRTGAALAALVLAAFSLFLSVVSTAGQVFSYDAFWHYLDNRVAAFFGLAIVGVIAGQWMAQRAGIVSEASQVLIIFLGLGLAVGAVLTMTISIAERQVVWDQGPAPIEGVVTELLDDPRGPTCWGALTHLREVPARGVTRELPAWDPESGRLMSAR